MRDTLTIKKVTDSLQDEEVKACLRFVLTQIGMLKAQEGPLEVVVAELIELYDELMGLQEKKAIWDPVPACTHVHIVVGDSFAGSMKQALKGLGWMETHKLITLRENYAIGPLGDLDSPKGRKVRSDWFRDNITEAVESCTEFEEEYNELLDKVKQIPEQAEIIIWTSGNAYEQMGMRHALHLLHGKRNVFAVYDTSVICKELYNRPDAFRYSGEIPTDKLQEALIRMDGSGKLCTADITQLEREWQAISEQSGTLRIWRDNVVLTVSADYYDQYLLEKLDELKASVDDNGFLRSARLIGVAIAYCEQYIGDSYFEYRLRELIYDGILEIKGIPTAMRFYSIKRKRRTESELSVYIGEPSS
ncbi:hypothetical protein D1872_192430 [compost metagenome]